MSSEITKRIREKAGERDELLRQLDGRYVAEEFLRSQGLEVPDGKFSLGPRAYKARTRIATDSTVYGFMLNGVAHVLKPGTDWPKGLRIREEG